MEGPDTELASGKPKTAVARGQRGTSLLPSKRGTLCPYVETDEEACEKMA